MSGANRSLGVAQATASAECTTGIDALKQQFDALKLDFSNQVQGLKDELAATKKALTMTEGRLDTALDALADTSSSVEANMECLSTMPSARSESCPKSG